jgi:hypothetical protein
MLAGSVAGTDGDSAPAGLDEVAAGKPADPGAEAVATGPGVETELPQAAGIRTASTARRAIGLFIHGTSGLEVEAAKS